MTSILLLVLIKESEGQEDITQWLTEILRHTESTRPPLNFTFVLLKDEEDSEKSKILDLIITPPYINCIFFSL